MLEELNWHTISIIGSILGSVSVLGKLMWDIGKTQQIMRTNELKHIEDKLDENTAVTVRIANGLEQHLRDHAMAGMIRPPRHK